MSNISDESKAALTKHLSVELSESYDATRVWEAWTVGTMSQDDFVPVNDRLDDIVTELLPFIDAQTATLAVALSDERERLRIRSEELAAMTRERDQLAAKSERLCSWGRRMQEVIRANGKIPVGTTLEDGVAALRSAVEAMRAALKDLLFAAENADETGYVTDAGFVDLDSIYAKASEALAADAGRPMAESAWRPIETFIDNGGKFFFWVVPRTSKDGPPWTAMPLIPHRHEGRSKTWGCLYKPTHWMMPPAAPTEEPK